MIITKNSHTSYFVELTETEADTMEWIYTTYGLGEFPRFLQKWLVNRRAHRIEAEKQAQFNKFMALPQEDRDRILAELDGAVPLDGEIIP